MESERKGKHFTRYRSDSVVEANSRILMAFPHILNPNRQSLKVIVPRPHPLAAGTISHFVPNLTELAEKHMSNYSCLMEHPMPNTLSGLFVLVSCPVLVQEP